MLTRLEVDGFKNLLNLSVDFGPFTCVAGENGAGKSNLFDVIHFMSRLASRSLMEAAHEVRTSREERAADPRDLFWNGQREGQPTTRLAAEMIIPKDVEDDFGRPATASITFLRYEVRIGYEPPTGPEKLGRLVLLSENLRHIRLGDAGAHLGFPHSVKDFRQAVVVGRRSGKEFISTREENGHGIITIHQDGGSRGKPYPASAARAPATVVSTVTGADDPTILAARREMQQWRRLALEPTALRAADRYTDPRTMDPDGRHLAATLYRVAHASAWANGQKDPAAVYARIAGRLASLTGLDVRRLRVDADDTRELLTVILEESSGLELPARSLSEGTLRFLALAVMLEDPTVEGLICMEEPENGLHPSNIGAMVALVHELAVDPFHRPGQDNPFRQVIVNTHSPAVVQLVGASELLYATSGPIHRDQVTGSRLRLRPLQGTWRAARAERGDLQVGKADLIAYLTQPAGAQLTLEGALSG